MKIYKTNYSINNFIQWLIYSVLFFSIIFKFTPITPISFGVGLDPSWTSGLATAINNELSFGRDLIFTYGPYASIVTKIYNKNLFNIVIISGLILSLFYFLSIISINRNKYFLLIFIILIFNVSDLIEPFIYSYVFLIPFLYIKNLNDNLISY